MRGRSGVPLRLFRGLVSGEIRLRQFANSLRHFVEALVEEDVKKGKTINTRSTSTRFDAHGKVDLRHAVEPIAVLAEGSQPKRVTEKVLDVGPTIRALGAIHQVNAAYYGDGTTTNGLGVELSGHPSDIK